MKHVILMLLASAAVAHVAPALADDPINNTEEESLGVSSEASVDESADDSADERAVDDGASDALIPHPPPLRTWVCDATAPFGLSRLLFPGYGWTRRVAEMNAIRSCQSWPIPLSCQITDCVRIPRRF